MSAYSLCVADDATFWPWQSTRRFASWPSPERTVVVLPLAGFGGADPEQPLDREETVLLSILRSASQSLAPAPWLLVLPPLRFVAGPAPECPFAVDPPLAHALIAEWIGSAAMAGFRRFLLLNASPWNEEICAAAARDLRVERGLDLFVLNQSALGGDTPETAVRLAGYLRELRDWTAPEPSR